jgi:hypothetical protein
MSSMSLTKSINDAIMKWEHKFYQVPKVIIIHPQTFWQLKHEWNENMDSFYTMKPDPNDIEKYYIRGCRVFSSPMATENDVHIY